MIELSTFVRKCIACRETKPLKEFRIEGPSAVNMSKWCHDCAVTRKRNAKDPTHRDFCKERPEANQVRMFPRKYTERLVDRPIVEDGRKYCTRCLESKPMEEFSRDNSRPLGRQYYCKACSAEMNKTSYRRRVLAHG